MVELAISRTPPEIWREAFKYVLEIEFLLICGRDKSQFELLLNHGLFSRGCYPARSYLKSERIRNKLRLVCHSWNEQLTKTGAGLTLGRHFLMTNFATLTWPESGIAPIHQIHRLELIHNKICNCLDLKCPVGRSEREQRTMRSVQAPKLLSTYEALPKLEFLVLDSSYGNQHTSFLLKATALKALVVIGDHIFRTIMLNSVSSMESLTRLTHLSLVFRTPHVLGQFARDIYLPNLEYLSLECKVEPRSGLDRLQSMETDASNAEWWIGSSLSRRLPKVSVLSLSGFADSGFLRALDLFRSQLASTLVELSVVGLRWHKLLEHGPIPMDLHIRNFSPNLQLYSVPFGVKARNYEEKPPSSDPSQYRTPLALLIAPFPVDWSEAEEPIVTLIAQAFITECEALHCDRVFLEVTWEEYNEPCRYHWNTGRANVENDEECKKCGLAGLYFAYLIAHGVGVYDRNQAPYEVTQDVRLRMAEKNLDSSLNKKLDLWISAHRKQQEVENLVPGWVIL